MKKALIVYGGWDGHEPDKVSALFAEMLEQEGFSVTRSDSLEAFADLERLRDLHLIVPIWTMGEIDPAWSNNVVNAVADGTGLAGCHGGMCDAFRKDVTWQFMTGANWVSHPGGDQVEYRVNLRNSSSPLVEGIQDFSIKSEQYYLHVDPAIEVLATTRFPSATWFHSSNREVDMPQVWTKRWGVGRVYYNALGHHADVFDIPEARELMRRGLLWAAEGKDAALRDGVNGDAYRSNKKMI
ncbi:MAG: ThuA domain-containing protein [Verrucomicrobia bacterium]|nr:ThuA domain-containing protein [Verrucomicrobiota bacterium]MCH8527299.1 ThuA domain-containing protein [Kiritimatiellia bacterium]